MSKKEMEAGPGKVEGGREKILHLHEEQIMW